MTAYTHSIWKPGLKRGNPLWLPYLRAIPSLPLPRHGDGIPRVSVSHYPEMRPRVWERG
jgi:hypothetical protein